MPYERPRLLHEALRAENLPHLDRALSGDLTGCSRTDLHELRASLKFAIAMEPASGALADRKTWQKAIKRVDDQLAVTPYKRGKPGRKRRWGRPDSN